MSQYSDSKFNKGEANSSWYKTFHLIPEGSTVLDIGCSSGVFGERLIKEKSCRVDGIEVDSDDAKQAKKRLRNVYQLNVEIDDLDLDEIYDIIFMGDVIEHLAKPIEALRKVKKFLKPEGSLVFSIPNITHMSVRLMLLKGQIKYGETGLLDETHLHFYNQEEVYRVLGSAGFKIIKFDYVERDIPMSIIEKELKDVGLNTTDNFKSVAQSINGAAYQFIGMAKPSSTKSKPLLQKSPIDITDRSVERMKMKYGKKIDDISSERMKMKKKIDDISSERMKMKKKIDDISSERDQALDRLSRIESSSLFRFSNTISKLFRAKKDQ